LTAVAFTCLANFVQDLVAVVQRVTVSDACLDQSQIPALFLCLPETGKKQRPKANFAKAPVRTCISMNFPRSVPDGSGMVQRNILEESDEL